MTREEAEAVRAEAKRAIAWIRRGDHPAIDDRWRTWTPPPELGIPTLAPDWETLPPQIGLKARDGGLLGGREMESA